MRIISQTHEIFRIPSLSNHGLGTPPRPQHGLPRWPPGEGLRVAGRLKAPEALCTPGEAAQPEILA